MSDRLSATRHLQRQMLAINVSEYLYDTGRYLFIGKSVIERDWYQPGSGLIGHPDHLIRVTGCCPT